MALPGDASVDRCFYIVINSNLACPYWFSRCKVSVPEITTVSDIRALEVVLDNRPLSGKPVDGNPSRCDTPRTASEPSASAYRSKCDLRLWSLQSRRRYGLMICMTHQTAGSKL